MPLPKPEKGEDKNHFINRCMRSSVIRGEYNDNRQRVAVCHSQWRRGNSVQQFLIAELQQMADSEIADMVPADVMGRLKQGDEHPVIRAYSIGHQGEAKATELKFGQRVIQYGRDTVQRLYDKIKVGIPAFDGHESGTNKHEGRIRLGNIVGKKLVDIGGILHTVIATYIRPQYRERHLDVASIEADVTYSSLGKKSWIRTFEDVTGVALGSSAVTTPALPGCTLLGSIQAFQAATLTRKGDITMELPEVKSAIAEGGWSPADIFGAQTLLLDEVVVKHVRKEKQTEYEHAKRVEGQLGEARTSVTDSETKFKETVTKLTAENVELTKQLNSSRAGTIVAEAMKSMDLTDKQEEFVLAGADGFSTDKADPDEVKEAGKTFVKGALGEFDKMSKLFTGTGGTGTANVGSGDGAGDEKPGDLSKPANNPFIPGSQGGDE